MSTGRRYDITALGEILVDMSEYGVSKRNNLLLEVSAGGAPANLLSMAARLGSRCAFIGKVGDDFYGHRLGELLSEQGISCEGLVCDGRYATTLAFVNYDEEGRKICSFSRKPGADAMLMREDIREELIRDARVFDFGTVSFSKKEGAEATRYAVEIAREADCIVAFDVNIRHNMVENAERLAEAIRFGLENANILKLSDEEMAEVAGVPDVKKGTRKLMDEHRNLELIFATMGRDGTYIRGRSFAAAVGALRGVNAVDTTGAGDSFFGTCLHFIAMEPERRFEADYVVSAANYASAAAGIVVSRVGSFSQMPTREEVAAAAETETGHCLERLVSC